jgi:hypothetical protein
MRKPSVTDHLDAKEKKGAIDAALGGGMEPVEVFKALVQNVYGLTRRKRMIVDWGKKMGLEASDSLHIAQGANLIPTSRKPPSKVREKPPHKT